MSTRGGRPVGYGPSGSYGSVGSATQKSRPRYGRIALIIALVLALVAGGAGAWQYYHQQWPFNPASQSYRDLGTTGLAVNDDAPKTIAAAPADPKVKPPFLKVQPLGGVMHVTPDGDLGTEITLRFALTTPVANPADVLIAFSETGEAGSWVVKAPTEVSKDGKFVYIKTNHLSWWQPLKRSFDELVNATLGELKRQFDGLTDGLFAETKQPTCKNEDLAKGKGYSLKWSGSEVLKFCMGLEGKNKDVPTVRIANKKLYPIFANHKGFTAAERPKSKFGLEMLGRYAFSKDRTVLMTADEMRLTLDLKKGEKKSLNTEYNGFAESIYQLEFGVTTLLLILSRFGAGGGTIKNGAIKYEQFDEIAELMNEFLGQADCLQAVATTDPNVGKILSSCFSASDLADILGWKGVLIGAAMVAAPVAGFFMNTFQTLIDLVKGSDKETLTVAYNPPQLPKALFVGEWHVHGAHLKIFENGTGTYTWNAGPCTSSIDEVRMCQGNAKLTFKVKSDGKSMVGTYSRVWYTTDGGPAPEDFDGAYEDRMQGMTFSVRRHDKHTLITSDGSGSRPGNPYLCDPYASSRNDTEQFQICGA